MNKEKKAISRRTFIKGAVGAAGVAALGGLGITGCAPKEKDDKSGKTNEKKVWTKIKQRCAGGSINSCSLCQSARLQIPSKHH